MQRHCKYSLEYKLRSDHKILFHGHHLMDPSGYSNPLQTFSRSKKGCLNPRPSAFFEISLKFMQGGRSSTDLRALFLNLWNMDLQCIEGGDLAAGSPTATLL